MSPRPRKVSDDAVFDALHRGRGGVEPAELTLALVGREAGITAGALVQRFGSKLGLMRAFSGRFAGGADAMLDALRARAGSPLGALEAYATSVAGMAETPATLAHHLAYLQMDLTDPEMFAHVRDHAVATRRALVRWIEEAVSAGDLRDDTDPGVLARLVHAVVSGSMLAYAFFREGAPDAWLRRDLAIGLRPYRRAVSAGPRQRKPGRKTRRPGGR